MGFEDSIRALQLSNYIDNVCDRIDNIANLINDTNFKNSTTASPCFCSEMKATYDLYEIYAKKFNIATLKNEENSYANICAVLLNKIREMEKQLLNELDMGVKKNE